MEGKDGCEVSDVVYTWNEIKPVAMNRSEWNDFIQAYFTPTSNDGRIYNSYL